MDIKLIKTDKTDRKISSIFLIRHMKDLDSLELDEQEKFFLESELDTEKNFVEVNRYSYWIIVVKLPEKKSIAESKEVLRQTACSVTGRLQEHKQERVQFINILQQEDYITAFLEGLLLSNYRFEKYLTGKRRNNGKKFIREVDVISEIISQPQLDELIAVMQAVYYARDMVNEPVSYLNAAELSDAFRKMGAEAGFRVEVFRKQKIESLRMGGLLAVNRGSVDPPTFSILEWKPEHPVNAKPLVFVGKGIVFDTGGLSLKPTKDSMDTMKSDMAGAAAVASAIYAIARNGIPCHVIGLIPATDNRPDGNAYAPGDVITMYDGTTVEVLNTDAEGRMVLADALAYAKQYDPELVIELSTLTGSAAIAIGKYGIVGMGTADEKEFNKLKKCGENVYERVVEFPFWDEYGELLKSDIADLKNIGGREAGAITAGKFLEHFTGYPYIHLDIAGPAFVKDQDSYHGKGATGIGVRLLYDFIKQKCRK